MRIESSMINLQGSSQKTATTDMNEQLNVWGKRGLDLSKLRASVRMDTFTSRQTDSALVSASTSTAADQTLPSRTGSRSNPPASMSLFAATSEISAAKYDSVSISLSGQASEAATCKTAGCEEDESDLGSKDQIKLKLIEAFIYTMTGKRVKLKMANLNLPKDSDIKKAQGLYGSSGQTPGGAASAASAATAEQSGQQGWGIIYNRTETHIEKSSVQFSATGLVKTSDGKEINLDLKFNIDQEIVKTSSASLRAGDALKDPLVINFTGNLASFKETSMTFDIDANGTADKVSMLDENSGYLAIDKNGNGTIDDGLELFGPKTDNGFSELAAYDDDQNGWIDENDQAFNDLKIWYHEADGTSRLVALLDKNIGAIYLGHASTRMDLYSGTSTTEKAGILRETGFALTESGQTRVVQELDLKI
jgi:hypothetical protein